jgi:RNA polymerase sigma-70 factor (ECF subfamily)
MDTERDFSAFFRQEFAPVLRVIELMMRDQARAEEITQDAFVQLHVHWRKVSGYDQPAAWVRRVAIRLAMRAIRRDRLWVTIRHKLVREESRGDSTVELAGAITRLSGAQRAAIVLHYYEDRPVREIASLLGCSEPTVRVHLHRGRQRLAALLREDDHVA